MGFTLCVGNGIRVNIYILSITMTYTSLTNFSLCELLYKASVKSPPHVIV